MEKAPSLQAPTPSTPQPTEQQPLPPSPSLAPPQISSSSFSLPSSSLPPSSSSTIPSSPNPNPSPPITQPQQSQPSFSRPWPQPSPFPHFSSHLQSMPPPPQHSSSSSASSSSPSPPPVPPFSSTAPSSISAPPAQRGGMAIGVPAHQPSPPPPSSSFSSLNPSSYGQQFGGLARNSTNVSESVTSSSSSQVRQPIQGIQGMGTMGSFGSGQQVRSGGLALHNQQRPGQSSARPQTAPNSQSPSSQNFQGHGMLRVSSVGSPVSPSPSTSQGMQPHSQPWLSSGAQGKPPLPPTSFRPQANALSLQQRSHIPQQHQHTVSTASQRPHASSSQQQQQQQPSSSHSLQEHDEQQLPPSRVTQSLPHQQQSPRSSGMGNQKASSLAAVQPSTLPLNRTVVSAETGEPCNRILSKRTIQELIAQVDPSERLDPEVEDILVDLADEFVEQITTFGCSLAKHRKSTTLEAKDILLHIERSWNMSLPGFSGDEIKSYRKPFASDIHRERLAVIRRSAAAAETANTKSSTGQAAGHAKGHLPKAPVNALGSPDP